jgi:hypothetical protein
MLQLIKTSGLFPFITGLREWILQIIRGTLWVGDRSIVRLVPTQGNHTKGSRHVMMLRMELDCTVTVIDLKRSYN